jgi:hypothetical protein
MAKQTIGLGVSANDNTGDSLRVGGGKVNDNFNELYSALGNGSTLQMSVTGAGVGQVLRYNGSSFAPANFSQLTSSLDVNGNSIISTSNGNINIAPSGTGDLTLAVGSVISTFDGATGTVTIPTRLTYTNEYTSLGTAPSAATYPGYFFTVNGNDNPYVNINITAGGIGDTQARVVTEYSTADLLKDINYATSPTNGQVLKWNSTNQAWQPGDDAAGLGAVNVFATITADTGTTTADSQTDTLLILGGDNITTSISGDTVTIDFDGNITTTFAALTDTDVTGLTQGDMTYWDGTDWVPTRSPVIWWELNATGENDYTFAGPGFDGVVTDPTLYVYRGFTYVFDNSIQGGGHPFRIQTTPGLTGTPYTSGQSGSGSGVLYWTVPLDAPNTLYYQCTLHALMQGTINVVS